MTYQGRMVFDLADRARLPWRFHGRMASAVLPE
jgi:hypothetical protein